MAMVWVERQTVRVELSSLRNYLETVSRFKNGSSKLMESTSNSHHLQTAKGRESRRCPGYDALHELQLSVLATVTSRPRSPDPAQDCSGRPWNKREE